MSLYFIEIKNVIFYWKLIVKFTLILELLNVNKRDGIVSNKKYYSDRKGEVIREFLIFLLELKR